MEPARRILLIRLGAVGDVVRTIPALGPLRELAPAAALAWVAEEGPASLLEGHPDLEETIVLPRGRIAERLGSPDTFFPGLSLAGRFARELRARRFDVSIDFHGTFKSGLVALASGAPVRYGYAPPGSKEGNRFFNNRLVPLPSGRLHRVRRTLAMLRALGVAESSLAETRIVLPIRREHRESVARFLDGAGARPDRRLAVMYPGASARQAYKRYPAERLAVVAGALAGRGVLPIVAGGPGEEDLVARVAAGAPGRAIVAPALGLLGLAELIRRCALFIGPDTGPMHIAWAVGTRVLALFGPTDPALNAPWGSGHTVVYNPFPGHGGEIAWPPADEVVAAALGMLERG